MIDLLKILLLSAEILWLGFFINYWIIPVGMSKAKREAEDDIDRTNNVILRMLAIIFYSPLVTPFKSILFFLVILVFTIYWLK
ncbi:hypothetical protein M5C99_13815 [Acidovorax sp. NCPPB 2350]|nr:hypothetical protein M5C99_13815 [Acidovorax sp. NCPPB 2350]